MEKFDIVNSDDESEEKGLLSGEINWLFIQVTVTFGEVTSLEMFMTTRAAAIYCSIVYTILTIHRVIG